MANNFYKDSGVDLSPMMYSSAGQAATHNPYSSEVVLGRYIPGSPQSYEQVAQTRGATYFEMTDWSKTQSIIGADNMWSINKAFLDQQMAQGKIFVFTGNPNLAPTGSFTNKELTYLLDSDYKLVENTRGTYRAIKK